MNEIQEHKYEIVEYKATEAVLADLRQKYENTVFDVVSTKGMIEARKARAEIREWRTGLENERKRIKADVLERGRMIDSEAKRLTTELVKLESPIDAQIQAEENRKEAEKQAKIEAERVRVATIQGLISDIRNIIVKAANQKSLDVADYLEMAKGIVIDERFAETTQEAQDAKDTVITLLESLYADTVAKEEEQVRIVAERAELGRLRMEQEAREREAERQRIEGEARARADQEKEDRRIAGERAKLEADKKAEEKRIADQRKAAETRLAEESDTERKHLAELRASEEARIAKERTELKAKQEAHEARIRAEQEETDRKRQEQNRIEVENARQKAALERQRQEQEEQARLLAEHRKRLAEARRDSHTQALVDILALANDREHYPHHEIVREEIALIAEASLEKKLNHRKKAA